MSKYLLKFFLQNTVQDGTLKYFRRRSIHATAPSSAIGGLISILRTHGLVYLTLDLTSASECSRQELEHRIVFFPGPALARGKFEDHLFAYCP